MIFRDGLYDELDMILEEAKQHVFKVRVDYATRIRVWKDQVLPDKRAFLHKHPGIENTRRMTDLVLRDALRLYRRALYEHVGNMIYVDKSKDEFPLMTKQVRKALEKQIEDIYTEICDLVSEELLEYEKLLIEYNKKDNL